jgi:hypothetical protein
MLKQRAQTTKPKLEKPQRAPPAHMQAPPGRMHANHLKKIEQLQQLNSVRPVRPVRPVGKIAQHLGTTPVRPVPSISQTDATWATARGQK